MLGLRSALTALLAGLALLASARPAPAAIVLLADGRTLAGVELKAGPSPAQVELVGGNAGTVTVGKDEILAVDFGRATGRPQPLSLRLANGDQFVGKIAFPGGRRVQLGNGWGSMAIPFSWCSAIRIAEKTPLPPPGPKDEVLLTNGDRVPGEITDIKENKVLLRVNDVPATLELARVKAIGFGRSDAPTGAASGLQVALDLGGGERLTARWVGLEGENLKLQPPWGGTVEIPVRAVSRLEVKNGKLVYLSDLKPTETTYVPYLAGADYPPRMNESAGGRPLRLAGKHYARGIGVHSRSTLTYALDGRFKTFAATLGIDSEVGAHGSVIFRVYGDDKVLFQSPIVRGGDEPIDLSLDVANVLALRLEVDYADNGDVADHADWADARLLRP